jgi:hypothetical protein
VLNASDILTIIVKVILEVLIGMLLSAITGGFIVGIYRQYIKETKKIRLNLGIKAYVFLLTREFREIVNMPEVDANVVILLEIELQNKGEKIGKGTRLKITCFNNFKWYNKESMAPSNNNGTSGTKDDDLIIKWKDINKGGAIKFDAIMTANTSCCKDILEANIYNSIICNPTKKMDTKKYILKKTEITQNDVENRIKSCLIEQTQRRL